MLSLFDLFSQMGKAEMLEEKSQWWQQGLPATAFQGEVLFVNNLIVSVVKQRCVLTYAYVPAPLRSLESTWKFCQMLFWRSFPVVGGGYVIPTCWELLLCVTVHPKDVWSLFVQRLFDLCAAWRSLCLVLLRGALGVIAKPRITCLQQIWHRWIILPLFSVNYGWYFHFPALFLLRSVAFLSLITSDRTTGQPSPGRDCLGRWSSFWAVTFWLNQCCFLLTW